MPAHLTMRMSWRLGLNARALAVSLMAGENRGKKKSLCAALALAAFYCYPATAFGEVTLTDGPIAGRIAVDFKGASIDEVLKGIGSRHGFEVSRVRPSQPVLSSGQYEGTVQDVLRRLLMRESHIIVTEGRGISRVVLYGPGQSNQTAVWQRPESRSIPSLPPSPTVIQAATRADRSSEPSLRPQAVAALPEAAIVGRRGGRQPAFVATKAGSINGTRVPNTR